VRDSIKLAADIAADFLVIDASGQVSWVMQATRAPGTAALGLDGAARP
jgi:hypothetical protein